MKIIDSSPIILLIDKINEGDALYILSENGENLKLPESVYNEFNNGATTNSIDGFIDDGVFDIIEGMSTEEEDYIKNRWPNLGSGEINVLAWAKRLQKEDKEFLCVLDDLNARRACETMGFQLTGSVGLLKLLKTRGLVSNPKIVEIVNKIRDSDFHIKEEILEDLLNA